MKNFLRFGFVLLFLVWGFDGVGQDFKCGTPERTKKEIQEMQNFYKNFALQNPNLPSFATQYVYIKFHNVLKNDLTGRNIASNISTILNFLNIKFASLNIEFRQSGNINYIISDQYYDLTPSEEAALRADNDCTNALNMYFLGDPAGNGGYANFPTLDGNRSTNATFMQSNVDDATFNNFVIAQVLPHELGHYFNLYHTFGKTNGGAGGVGGILTNELVNGVNCANEGDDVCDTPADPYMNSSWSVCSIQSSCTWNCTNTDANGQRYSPSMNNFMSYYQYCRNRFTPGQFYRMSGGLNLRNSLSIDLSQRYYLDGLDRIVLGNPSSTLLCSGSNVSVNFGAYDEPSFYQGRYYLQMKAVDGGYFFSNISPLSPYTSSGAGTMTGTIPTNTPSGYYQIRVCKIISESLQRVEERTIYINGITNGIPTGSPIASQYALATTTLNNVTSTCAGNTIALYGSVSGYDSYWWTKDGLNYTASSTNSYFNASSTGNYTLNMIKCGNVYRSSNSIYLTFYNTTIPSITASSNGSSSTTALATCESSTVTLSTNCQSGMNPLWNDGSTSSIRYINASSTRDFMVNCSNNFCNNGYSPPVRITALNPNVQSQRNGNWQDVTLWTSNLVPLNCQTVTIQTGHTVNVPINDAKAKKIIINGKLNFQNVSPTVKGKVGLGI